MGKKGKKTKKVAMSLDAFNKEMGVDVSKNELPSAPTGLVTTRGRGRMRYPQQDRRQFRNDMDYRQDRRGGDRYNQRDRMNRGHDDYEPRELMPPSEAEESKNWRRSGARPIPRPQQPVRHFEGSRQDRAPFRDRDRFGDRQDRTAYGDQYGDRQDRGPYRDRGHFEDRGPNRDRGFGRDRAPPTQTEEVRNWRNKPIVEPNFAAPPRIPQRSPQRSLSPQEEQVQQQEEKMAPLFVDKKPEESVTIVVEEKNALAIAMETGSDISIEELDNNVNLSDEYDRSCLVRSIAKSILESKVTLAQCFEIFEKIPEYKVEVFEGILVELLNNISQEDFIQILKESALDIHEILDLKHLSAEELEQQLSQRQLTVLLTNYSEKEQKKVPEVVEEEEKIPIEDQIIFNDDSSAGDIVSALEKVIFPFSISNVLQSVAEEDKVDAHILSAGKFVFLKHFGNPDFSVLEDYAPVIRWIGDRPCRDQKLLIDAAVNAWSIAGMELKRSGKKLFEELSNSFIDAEAFIMWRDDESNKNDSKKKLLIQVSSVLFEIEQIFLAERYGYDEEEEEEEEEYE